MQRSTPLARVAAIALTTVLAFAACGDDADPTATLTEPADGTTVHGAVRLTMSAEDITIEEAGEARDDAGHFHVLADQDCLAEGTAIGKDADTVHFGAGQAEGVIYLGPGDHELCLQVGDGLHAALDVTDTARVTVEITSQGEWCTVIGEADELQAEVDTIEEFAAAQVGFENLARLMEQLLAGMEFVDDEVRAELESAVELGRNVARAFVDAADFDDAFDQIESLYEAAGDDEALPGATWVRDTCGVDLED
jgi:hypothetical protein